MNPLAIALIVFAVLMFLGMPIVFVMTFSSLVYCVAVGKIALLMVVIEKMFRGMDSFVLLAIPMFIMCGEVMNRGGITTAIVRFADLLVGRVRGGLAYVNTLASTFFAGITGSALSDIASLGSILIPAMEEQGYRFGAGEYVPSPAGRGRRHRLHGGWPGALCIRWLRTWGHGGNRHVLQGAFPHFCGSIQNHSGCNPGTSGNFAGGPLGCGDSHCHVLHRAGSPVFHSFL